ncbi:hypothetical protein K435DRAFT_962317 [Dendrothele bispora CBS 962.96]|uniref:Uncharacterized protein n=1 Tax=Dendrothele bispora (strain CBS 962.96) TaxID=1314807 RepID=A0A4S8MLR1_DENBC|nr:hypothetical protein K435DRAFT_962317 [Dendrothele bispora CBS 962.96]
MTVMEVVSVERFDIESFRQQDCRLFDGPLLVEKLFLQDAFPLTSRTEANTSRTDASVARQIGARTVKFDNLTAYYGLFTQIPDVLCADPDHRSIIETSKHGWWYTTLTPYNRPYNYSTNKYNTTSNVRVVIYYTDKSDPSARYAKTSSGSLKLLFRGTFYISRLLTKSINGGGSRRPSRSSMTAAKKNLGPTRICQTPAGSTHLTSCCNSRNGPSRDDARWCAVGDSVVAIDPLASQEMFEKPLLELEVKAEDADVDADSAEVEKVSMKMGAIPVDPTDKISIVMAKMRYEKEKKRLECYRQVGSGFQGEIRGKRK